MARNDLSPLSRALTVLRSIVGWDQTELADAAGIAPNVISDYERGQRELSRERLEELAGLLGLSAEAVDLALDFVGSVWLEAQAPGYPDAAAGAGRRSIEGIAARNGQIFAELTRSVLTSMTTESRALVARQQAPALWRVMKRRKPAERRLLVEGSSEFRSWALCELLCAESVKAAADNADRAVELAELALRIAELSPHEESWRCRLQGYAWAHVGNARRVRGDLPGAEEAFARSGRLWEDGAPGDPGLLDEALVPGLEASLRITQCRLSEAGALLDRALAVDRGAFRKHLLLNRARLLEWAGDYENALATLAEAAPLVSKEEEPRLLFMLRHTYSWNLTHLGRYLEAEALFPEIRMLVVRLDNDLDALRLRWLEGRVAAGLGRAEEALTALSKMREEFTARGIVYDAALATLELAVLYLEQGRTREVRTLARQMATIFRTQGVHREALAALKLFCEAAEKESATVELARRVAEYLYRAQHNPSLRFEALP
jgi:tetratricopeptide (TPR) repeat protein